MSTLLDLCSIGGDFLGHGFSNYELQHISTVQSFTKSQSILKKNISNGVRKHHYVLFIIGGNVDS